MNKNNEMKNSFFVFNFLLFKKKLSPGIAVNMSRIPAICRIPAISCDIPAKFVPYSCAYPGIRICANFIHNFKKKFSSRIAGNLSRIPATYHIPSWRISCDIPANFVPYSCDMAYFCCISCDIPAILSRIPALHN